ncbi:hypothetical protein HY373_01675 [Candidatus Berkelbacteria bacterium]|nr:hypothetical protein [Candidatus Berkelbacteria bacterium]MBI4029868.1 hypothetical protein [Candidatus Berkelbacteria bacterium]
MAKENKTVKAEFKKTLATLIISAFSLVAALAWNEAITHIIEKFIQPGQSIISWLIYALLVTLLAVLAGLYLGRLIQKNDS